MSETVKLSKAEQRVLEDVRRCLGGLCIREIEGEVQANTKTCQRLLTKGLISGWRNTETEGLQDRLGSDDVLLAEDTVWAMEAEFAAFMTDWALAETERELIDLVCRGREIALKDADLDTAAALIEKSILTRADGIDDSEPLKAGDSVRLAMPQSTTEEPTLPADKPPAEQAKPDEPPRRITRRLPCRLTTDELITLGDQIDELMDESEELEDEKKSSASDFNARLNKIAEQIRKLSNQRKGRTIEREVEVTITDDLVHAVQIVTRLDTMELVEKRTLNSFELQKLRQVEIPGTAAPAEKAPETDFDRLRKGATPKATEAIDALERGEEPAPGACRMLISHMKAIGFDPEHDLAKRCVGIVSAAKAAAKGEQPAAEEQPTGGEAA